MDGPTTLLQIELRFFLYNYIPGNCNWYSALHTNFFLLLGMMEIVWNIALNMKIWKFNENVFKVDFMFRALQELRSINTRKVVWQGKRNKASTYNNIYRFIVHSALFVKVCLFFVCFPDKDFQLHQKHTLLS